MDLDYIQNKLSQKQVYINGHEEAKRYSVIIPLVKIDDELYILFEVRSKKLKSQPGDVCFPGGKIESYESPKEAALRETMEELNLKEIDIIKELDITVVFEGTIIHSFVGIVNDIKDLRINEDEVEKTFYIPLSYLLNEQPVEGSGKIVVIQSEDFPYNLISQGRDYKFRQGIHKTYFYKYEDKVVWGISAKILRNFINSIKN